MSGFFTSLSSSDNSSASTSSVTYNEDTIVGVVIAIIGNLLISVSLTIQKYTHLHITSTNGTNYTREPMWWFGIVLMCLGETGNFSAYGFAPASVVAPLGATTVIANMFLAVLVLKEKLRPEDLFGCALSIVGAFLIVIFSSKNEKVLSASEVIAYCMQTAFIVYVSIEVLALVILFLLLYRFEIENVLILLLITAFTASFTVISAKAVSQMLQLTFAGSMQMNTWIFWVMVLILGLSAVAQIKYVNYALKLFASTIVVPTYFVFFSISAIVAGIVFYKEFWGMDALHIFMFLFGCLMCFIGVYFITAGRAGDDISVADIADDSTQAVTSIVPSWLLADVRRQKVQPLREDDGQPFDGQPFVGDAESIDVTDTPPEAESGQSETPVPDRPTSPKLNDYGALK